MAHTIETIPFGGITGHAIHEQAWAGWRERSTNRSQRVTGIHWNGTGMPAGKADGSNERMNGRLFLKEA
ncbi:hypothetical protein F6P93_14525 [Escherichia coli]|nr:hypothetical protein F6P93_14525 [Escherichia coli]